MKESEIRPLDLFNRFLSLSEQDIARFFSDRSQLSEVECPGCGGDSYQPAMEKFGFKYVTCTACGSLFVSPRPSEQMIDQYYRESQAVKFWESSFYKETSEARRNKVIKPRAEYVAKLARTDGGECLGTLVDVGAGFGIFLEEVAKLNVFADIVGIEPAPNLAEICRQRGFRVLEKPAERIESGELNASWATAFEVLEHVHSPPRFLQSIGNILQPGGKLVLTTLTVTGFDIQMLWNHSKSVHPRAP